MVSMILLECVTFYAPDGDSVEYVPRGATPVSWCSVANHLDT